MERLKEQEVSIAGESFVVRSDRTLYWPREMLLVVADVHIGKSEAFRQRGVTIPDGVLPSDLARLEGAIRSTQAKRLLVVGDFVHAGEGFTPLVDTRMRAWRERVPLPMSLVLGNHDRHHDRWFDAWGIDVRESHVIVRSVAFSHEPAARPEYVICGHLHPVITLRGGTDRLRLPCFVVGERRTILPAFSEFTGGAPHLPLKGERIYAVAGDYVVDVTA